MMRWKFWGSKKKSNGWTHEIRCRDCNKLVDTRYKDLCNTCYVREWRKK